MKKVDEEMFAENCTTEELPIKTDFSNLNLFTLDGIEDWRLSVNNKTFPKIQNLLATCVILVVVLLFRLPSINNSQTSSVMGKRGVHFRCK